jgi:hypothetical protein
MFAILTLQIYSGLENLRGAVSAQINYYHYLFTVSEITKYLRVPVTRTKKLPLGGFLKKYRQFRPLGG